MSAPGTAPESVTAWRPDVPGIAEVLRARFTRHAYPSHVHATWTLLIVDHGAVRYDLERRPHDTAGTAVTLLPPDVPHDGRAATGDGFGKRVLYLDAGALGPDVLDRDGVGRALHRPGLDDPALHQRLDRLHRVLDAGCPDPLHAQSRFAFVAERLAHHLGGRPSGAPEQADAPLADRLRELLDARVQPGIALDEAGRILHAHPTHLVRAFSRAFGIPPHRYLDGRRVDLARRLLLDGTPPADVAHAAGFFDQAHLTRRFARTVGVTPARYAAGSRRSGGRVSGGAAPPAPRTLRRERR